MESLDCFPRNFPLCFGDSHPFKGSWSDQVCLEFGNHGQNIEQEPAHGIGGVMDGAIDAEFYLATGELIHDALRIAQ